MRDLNSISLPNLSVDSLDILLIVTILSNYNATHIINIVCIEVFGYNLVSITVIFTDTITAFFSSAITMLHHFIEIISKEYPAKSRNEKSNQQSSSINIASSSSGLHEIANTTKTSKRLEK